MYSFFIVSIMFAVRIAHITTVFFSVISSWSFMITNALISSAALMTFRREY